ncbi:MAG: hypothetical protein BRD55_04780 [Bacteroidetes bacterium SW_9_63_38]|nr:MAG: hypothetical protein BRD55_04780 [Bacteroidetes bacterium SW_9_63_38]
MTDLPDPVSPSALNDFLGGVFDRLPDREEWQKVCEYKRQLAHRGQAFLSRFRGEPTAMPPVPDPPDCIPRPTRPIEEIRQSLAERAARLGTEEDEKRE